MQTLALQTVTLRSLLPTPPAPQPPPQRPLRAQLRLQRHTHLVEGHEPARLPVRHSRRSTTQRRKAGRSARCSTCTGRA